jgi:putative membrane protein
MLRLIAAILALLPTVASAHHGESVGPHAWDIVLASLLVASAVSYATGLARLWRRAGGGRGISRANAICFATGWITLAVALAGPLDAWSERSFALHMIQHELLMVIAAPLLVLGRPLEGWAWVIRWRSLQNFCRGCSRPVIAFLAHAGALWIWHLPALFAVALANESVHVLQHACFFLSAIAFWGSVLHPARARDAAALATLFATLLHTSALGALLTLAPTVWYAPYREGVLGLSALEDQQLGGLVMWMPAGFAYVVAALWIASRWLEGAPVNARRVHRVEAV